MWCIAFESRTVSYKETIAKAFHVLYATLPYNHMNYHPQPVKNKTVEKAAIGSASQGAKILM
jgi:hypothetical protein